MRNAYSQLEGRFVVSIRFMQYIYWYIVVCHSTCRINFSLVQGNTSRHDDDRTSWWTRQVPGAAAEPVRRQQSHQQVPDRDLLQRFQTLTGWETPVDARQNSAAKGAEKSATTDVGLIR